MPFIEDKTPPLGQNEMYLPHQVTMRQYYKEKIYPSFSAKPIDLWYGRPFYGKVDVSGKAIHISETNLKLLPQTSLFVADFVADAYEDFISELHTVIRFNGLSQDSFLRDLSPLKAWSSVHTLYHVYFGGLHKLFVDNYINFNNRKNKIKNFDDYIKLFLRFVEGSVMNIPFSKSSFILSRFCTPHVSALMIELGVDSHEDDYIKFQKYINTDEFECYRNTAAKFGFYIDKNAPWRLIANIASAEMMKYVRNINCEIVLETPHDFGSVEGFPFKLEGADVEEEPKGWDYKPSTFSCEIENVEQLLSAYYYSTSKYDYESLKIYLFQSYNTYTSVFPEYENWQYCLSKKETQVSFKERETFSDVLESESEKKAYDIFSKRYDDSYWLPIYYFIRAKEAKLKLTNFQKKKTLVRIKEIFRHFGLDDAIDFIDEQTSVTKIYQKALPQDQPAKIDQKVSPQALFDPDTSKFVVDY